MLTRELGAGTALSPEPPGPLAALPPLLLPSAPRAGLLGPGLAGAPLACELKG